MLRLVCLIACGFFLFSSAAWAQTVTAFVYVGTTQCPSNCPHGVAVNPVTNKIYVPMGGPNGVAVIDGATNSVTWTASVLWEPTAVAVNPVTNRIYVANITQQGSGEVVVVDGATNGTLAVSAGSTPVALAVNPVTNKIYVANSDSNNVTVLDGQTLNTTTVSAGSAPRALAVNPVTNKIYVANSGSNNVTVIDGATNGTTTISAGANPIAVAVNPVTSKIYIANHASGDVTVIDGATNSIATVSIGDWLYAIGVNPVTDTIYVVTGDSNVTAIDGSTNAFNTFSIEEWYPDAVALNPLTSEIYVPTSNCWVTAEGYKCYVSVMDGTGAQVAVLRVGGEPRAVAVNPVTNTIYVANYDANVGSDATVTVLAGDTDGVTTTGTATVSAGTGPKSAAVNPATNKIYVANSSSNNVTVIDGATNATTTVSVGAYPSAVAVNPVTNRIYVANQFSDNVTVIDGATNATTTVSAGSGPGAVAVNPVTNKIYVANIHSNNVTVIDGATNATATVSAGTWPTAVDVDPMMNLIYVANQSSNDVTVIDGTTNAAMTVSAGTEPFAVAVNPATHLVYVANWMSNDVTVLYGTVNICTIGVGNAPDALAVNPVTDRIYVSDQSGNMTVIDGASNATSTTTTLAVGTLPYAVAVNPVTNKIYVANMGSGDVTVIDGSTNTTWTVGAGIWPLALGVNPVTNLIYVANGGSGDVTVISPNAKVNVPLTTVLTGTTDAQTIAGNAIFSTSSSTPSFTAAVTSNFTPNAPPPTALYYQLDAAQGVWQQATATSASGSNPASYSFTLSNDVPRGVHTVYTYAAYGDEGTSEDTLTNESDWGWSSRGQGVGNFPVIGSLAALTFAVLPIPTATQLTADVNPQNAGSPVTLTAYVQSTYGDGTPSGTVTFLDGTAQLALGAVDSGSHASFQTGSLAAGIHSITAAYSGGASYGASTSSALSEVIAGAPASIAAISGGGQSAPVDTAFGAPLVVSVTDSNNNPVPNVPVTFSGVGLSFSNGGTVATGSNGQASITATPTAVGSVLASANVTGLSPATFNLTAAKHPTAISWPQPAPITYGAVLSATQLNASATGIGGAALPGSFVYSPATGTILNAGMQTLFVTFTPSDTTDYATATTTVTLAVNRALPTVSAWPTASAIASGQTLASSTLSGGSATNPNNAAPVPGSFAWMTPSTAPAMGTASCGVTFTPADTVDYTTVSGSVSVTVNQATPTITWATPAAITYGTALGLAQLDATANVPGTLAYRPAAGTVLAAGNQSLSVTFTPTDTTDYSKTAASVTLTVNQALPAVSAWPTASAITSGETLASSMLSGGTASVPGGFAWTTPSTVPAVGTASYGMTFMPIDTTDYTTVSGSVSVTATAAAAGLAIKFNGSSAQTVTAGDNAGYSFTLNPAPAGSTFANAVTFGVTGLPSGATATFTPSSIAAGSGATNVALIIETENTSAQGGRQKLLGKAAPLALALLLVPLVLTRQRVRRWLAPAMMLGVLTWTAALTGCGGSSNGSGGQSYSVTITATSGSMTQSAVATLTVK
jgi:YVTN family beta-propeller protein